jgi:hypothetical protein
MITLGAGGYMIWLVVVLFIYFGTAARVRIVSQLVVSALLLAIAPSVEWAVKRKLTKMGLRCTSCHKLLIGSGTKSTVETGQCGFCGTRAFELQDPARRVE